MNTSLRTDITVTDICDGFVYNVCSDICCWGNGGYGGSAEGGAIWVRNQKTLTIRGGSFASNSAVGGRGGAPGNPSGREGQAGNGNGGGIYADPETSATIDKTTVRQNNATDGGGIFFGRIGSAFVLTNSTLVGNTVTSKGGGLWLYANPTAATIKNCTFSDNVAGGCSAVGSGAALYNYVSLGQTTGGALVVGCTFNNNSITNLYSPSFLLLANTILKGGPCYQDVHDGGAGYSSQGFNISNTSAGGDAGTGPGGRLNGAGDIRNTDPMLDPAGLQNNGGPTQTIRLLAGSPAIDKGKSFGLGTDQRGRGRPDDDFAIANASGGDGSDIGAYEVPGSPQPGPALVVTAVDDHDDGGGASACTGDCTLREAINAANSIAGDKTITFASHVRGTTLLTSALPAVATNVNLQGPGARALEINGNNLYRVFSFTGGTSSVSGLTIANGRASNLLEGLSWPKLRR